MDVIFYRNAVKHRERERGGERITSALGLNITSKNVKNKEGSLKHLGSVVDQGGVPAKGLSMLSQWGHTAWLAFQTHSPRGKNDSR